MKNLQVKLWKAGGCAEADRRFLDLMIAMIRKVAPLMVTTNLISAQIPDAIMYLPHSAATQGTKTEVDCCCIALTGHAGAGTLWPPERQGRGAVT